MASYKALYEQAKREWAYDVARIEDMQQTIERLSDSLTNTEQAFAAHKLQTKDMVDLSVRTEIRQAVIERDKAERELCRVYEAYGRHIFAHRNCGVEQ